MKILVTGGCGFVGYSLIEYLMENVQGLEIIAVDNLTRNGSWINIAKLKSLGIPYIHADIRSTIDLFGLSRCDWVIDCAAFPSVLAGTTGYGSTAQLVDNNLTGTSNILNLCHMWGSGLIMLSTSRVYSIERLINLTIEAAVSRYNLTIDSLAPCDNISCNGLTESFSTSAPLSLYGSTKYASEILALEYHKSLDLPVWINRCGVISGSGQFGKAEQGICSFWINSWLSKSPLSYIGFNKMGYQVRDVIHVNDLAALIVKQLGCTALADKTNIFNVSGGKERSFSLLELSIWCQERIGPHKVDALDVQRPFDIPWLVLDSTKCKRLWNWDCKYSLDNIFEDILEHGRDNPDWLKISS